MNKHTDLPIWENRKRSNFLKSFINEINKYVDNYDYGNTVRARAVDENIRSEAQTNINYMTTTARKYLIEAGIQTIKTWQQFNIQATTDFITDIIPSIQSIHADIVKNIIEQGIGVYDHDKCAAWIRTFNPFFWIHKVITTVTYFPIRLVIDILNDKNTENSSLIKLFHLAFTFLAYWQLVEWIFDKFNIQLFS